MMKEKEVLFNELIKKSLESLPDYATPTDVKRVVTKLMNKETMIKKIWYIGVAIMLAMMSPFLISHGGSSLGLWDPNSGISITSYILFGLLIVALMFPITLGIIEKHQRMVEQLELYVDKVILHQAR